jgi:hypothetical protein
MSDLRFPWVLMPGSDVATDVSENLKMEASWSYETSLHGGTYQNTST